MSLETFLIKETETFLILRLHHEANELKRPRAMRFLIVETRLELWKNLMA